MRTNWLQEQTALRHCQHDATLVRKVRQSFYQQHVGFLTFTNLTPDEAQQLAHSLKSTAPAIGAGPLSEIASQLAPPASVPGTECCQKLLNALQKTLQALQARLPDADHNSITKDLRSQLEQHNIGALKLFSHWTEHEAMHWPAGYLDEMRAALATFDFRKATALLDDGLKRFISEPKPRER